MIWTRLQLADKNTRRRITEQSEKFCIRHNINPKDFGHLGPELTIQRHCEFLRSSDMPEARARGEYEWQLWTRMVNRFLARSKDNEEV